jgi:hypothetical protein
MNQKEKAVLASAAQEIDIIVPQKTHSTIAHADVEGAKGSGTSAGNLDMNTFFDFTIDGSYGLEWAKKFLELDEDPWLTDLKIKGEHCYIYANNNCFFYLLIHEKNLLEIKQASRIVLGI